MSDPTPPVGSIGWLDLTVDDADEIRDFYAAVVGWTHTPVDMGGYADHCMNQPGDGKSVAGVCHRTGPNADLPSVWLVYVIVADLEASLGEVRARGGEVVAGPKTMGPASYAVVRDPRGATLALYQPDANA